MSLELIIGPMFAGKSSTLIQRIGRAESLGWKCCTITSTLDTRYGTAKSVFTHTGDRLPALGMAKLEQALLLPEYAESTLIFIDEAQFFPDLYATVMRMVEEDSKRVTVVGLDGDYKRNPFGQIHDLIPKADSYTKLTAFCKICADGTPGVFTMKCYTNSDQILIGGADMYKAVCRKHFLANPSS